MSISLSFIFKATKYPLFIELKVVFSVIYPSWGAIAVKYPYDPVTCPFCNSNNIWFVQSIPEKLPYDIPFTPFNDFNY